MFVTVSLVPFINKIGNPLSIYIPVRSIQSNYPI